MFYLLCVVLGALLGVGIMCLFQINRQITSPAPVPPVAKEEPHTTPAYRYDPITRKPTRRLP